jgi:hypothetical protein
MITGYGDRDHAQEGRGATSAWTSRWVSLAARLWPVRVGWVKGKLGAFHGIAPREVQFP